MQLSFALLIFTVSWELHICSNYVIRVYYSSIILMMMLTSDNGNYIHERAHTHMVHLAILPS